MKTSALETSSETYFTHIRAESLPRVAERLPVEPSILTAVPDYRLQTSRNQTYRAVRISINFTEPKKSGHGRRPDTMIH